MSTHIVIPDSHAKPNQDLRRYDWLGKLIVDVKPDVVIDIGDWFDMESLCTYEKGMRQFEGRRYRSDIEAGIEAQDRLLSVVRRQKRKLPRFVRTLGNHEHRIVRATELDAVLHGTISLDDLQSKEYLWEQHDFLTPVDIDGVLYSHFFTSGVMGRPIGGVNHARSLLVKNIASCTQGHSHSFDFSRQSTATGRKINGCVVGCYFEEYHEWAGPANNMYDRGVVIKRGVQDGDYDLEWISIERMEELYGR